MKLTEKQILKMYRIVCDTCDYSKYDGCNMAGMNRTDRLKFLKEIEDQQTDNIIDLGSKDDFSFPQPSVFIKDEK